MDHATEQPGSPSKSEDLVRRLFIQHQMQLRGLLLAIIPDFAAVDDIIQETFLTVSRKAADFVPDTNFLAWAAAIARLHALDYRRKHGRWANGLSEQVIEQLYAHPGAVIESEQADRELTALEDCLGTLAPHAREAITLRYREGHKPAEVARRLGWTAEAVYVALSRARSLLRSCIERRLAWEGGGA